MLGILLFAVEIGWFVGRPIWMEVRVWLQRRAQIRLRNMFVGGLLLAGFIALLAWPWRTPVHAPGWLRATEQQAIYSPVSARILSLRPDGPVRAGDVVATLDSPDTRSKATQAAILADALAQQLDRSIGRSDRAARRAGFTGELRERLAEWAAQRAELRRLELRAPFDGVLLDGERQIAPGVWVNAKQPLAMLIASGAQIVEVFVNEQALYRLKVGVAARFYDTAAPDAPRVGQVISIDPTRTTTLPHPMLATTHGGAIPIVGDPKNLAPRDALYRVMVRIDPLPDGNAAVPSMRAGNVRIDGEPMSLLRDWGRSIAGVFVRESGF